MLLATLTLLGLAADHAAAHYDLLYPEWRGDSYIEPASQWTYPCANLNTTTDVSNRTVWPLTGGSLAVELGHHWTYIWVNLGLGDDVLDFNVSLTPNVPLNASGEGTLCLTEIAVPESANATEGALASLQVVTVGDSGSALYNCADIVFRADATLLEDGEGLCTNSSGIEVERVRQSTFDSEGESGSGEEEGEEGSATEEEAAETSDSAAGALRVADGSLWTLSAAMCGVVAAAAAMLGAVNL